MGEMSLKDVNDELERALLRRKRYFEHEAGSYNARFEVAALIRLLVLHGDLLVDTFGLKFVDDDGGDRFAALKDEATAALS